MWFGTSGRDPGHSPRKEAQAGLTFDAELEATIVSGAKICKVFSLDEK
jgi:hypothetical protein